MEAREILGPVEFRFTDEADVALYGVGWYRYAEEDLVRLPARALIQLESELGMSPVDVMNGVRMRTILGDTAAAWLGVRAVDPALAGEFDRFNPITMLIVWRQAVGDEGKGSGATGEEATPDAPATPEPGDSSFPSAGHRASGISDPPRTVVLQTLPVAE